jgi:peptide/nickel transport system ATP-binding protein
VSVLEVSGLRTCFLTDQGDVAVVDGVSFALEPGRTLGLVGESGCGKSVTSLSIMGLLPAPAGRVADGAIRFDGTDLRTLPAEALRALRGNRLAMIFQEPMTSLNPAFTIGDQIGEVLTTHQSLSPAAARAKTIELLRRVHIPAPETRVDDYPHQLSGGMRQRAMIAMAIACNPKLLIADEPTTALDVTVQAQILDLLRELRRDNDMAMVLITHDLGVIAEMADEVAVMYAGRIVETAPVKALFEDTQHPYTIGLLGSLPRLDERKEALDAVEGSVPDALHMPSGCRFHPRCPFALPRCREDNPGLIEVRPGHQVACWRAPLA